MKNDKIQITYIYMTNILPESAASNTMTTLSLYFRAGQDLENVLSGNVLRMRIFRSGKIKGF